MKDARVEMVRKMHPVAGEIHTIRTPDITCEGGWIMLADEPKPNWMVGETWKINYGDPILTLSDAICEKSDNFWKMNTRVGSVRELGMRGVYVDGCMCGCLSRYYAIRLEMRGSDACGDGWIPRYMLEILKKEKRGCIMGCDRWVAYQDEDDLVWMSWEKNPGWMNWMSKFVNNAMQCQRDAIYADKDGATYAVDEMLRCVDKMKFNRTQILKDDGSNAIRWSADAGWVSVDDNPNEDEGLSKYGINGVYAKMVFKILGEDGTLRYGDWAWSYDAPDGQAVVMGLKF